MPVPCATCAQCSFSLPVQLRAELERQSAEKGVSLKLPPLPGSSGGSSSQGQQLEQRER